MFQDVLAQVAESFSGERARDAGSRPVGHRPLVRLRPLQAQRRATARRRWRRPAWIRSRSSPSPPTAARAYGDWVAPLAWDVTGAELRDTQPAAAAAVRLHARRRADWRCGARRHRRGAWRPRWSCWTTGNAARRADRGAGARSTAAGQDSCSAAGRTELEAPGDATRRAGRHLDHHAAYGARQPSGRPTRSVGSTLWSDHPIGWPFTRADTPAFGFSLSARQGGELPTCCGAGSRCRRGRASTPALRRQLRLRHRRDTRPADRPRRCWSSPTSTSRAPRTTPAAVRSCWRRRAVCNALIKQGRLPQPRRSIRFVLSWEIYGLLAYAATRPAAMRRCSRRAEPGQPGRHSGAEQRALEVHPNPHAQASYTDALIQRIARAAPAAGRAGRTVPFDTTDAVIADPTIGMPDALARRDDQQPVAQLARHAGEDRSGDPGPARAVSQRPTCTRWPTPVPPRCAGWPARSIATGR